MSGVARCPGVPTGQILHLVEPDGHRRYVEVVGANGRLRPAARDVAAACAPAATLLLSTAVPQAAAEVAVAAAREAGARVVVDVAGDVETSRAVLAGAHVVRGDADEVSALVDRTVCDFDSAAEAARRILSHGGELAVVQAGDAGEVVVSAEQELRVPRRPVPVVDPTGGGDALVATLAVLLARGRPLDEAAHLASAAAAHTAAKLGGRPAFRDEAELAQLLTSAH